MYFYRFMSDSLAGAGACGMFHEYRWCANVGFLRSVCLTSLFGITITLHATAFAQQVPPNAVQDAIRSEESKRAQEEAARQRQADQQTRITVEAKTIDSASTDKDVQYLISKINVSGVETLDPAAIEAVTKRFVGTKMGLIEIENLRTAIGRAYARKGYSLIQVFQAEQDLSSGELSLLVVEGKLEALRICKNGRVRKGANTAFRVPTGSIFKLRPYEQGIETLAGLFSYEQSGAITVAEITASSPDAIEKIDAAGEAVAEKSEQPIATQPAANMDATDDRATQFKPCTATEANVFVIPGSKVGYSVIEVNSFQARPIWFSAGSDNLGSSSTGKIRFNAGVGLEDVLGLYESLVLRGSHTSKFDKGDDRARNVSADLSLPYGYWNFHVGGSYFDYRTTVQAANQPFLTDGDQKTVSADVERVLRRGQSDVVTLGAGIELRNTTNSVNGLRLASSSRKLTVLNAHLSRRGTLLGGSIVSDISISQGIRAFDALRDVNITKAQPHAQFTTVSLSLDFQRGFSITKTLVNGNKQSVADFGFRSSLIASWAPHALFGSEKVQIGGPFTVRGFDNNNLSGDIGGYVRNELSYFPRLKPQTFLSKIGRPSLFVGLDSGVITKDYADPAQEDTLVGVAGGIRWSGRNLTTEARIETPLSRPAQLRGEKGIFRFSASLRL
jgi:hemolysin activation/secretion protein